MSYIRKFIKWSAYFKLYVYGLPPVCIFIYRQVEILTGLAHWILTYWLEKPSSWFIWYKAHFVPLSSVQHGSSNVGVLIYFEINRVRNRSIPGKRGPGRPRKTWNECVDQDLKTCSLSKATAKDRVAWPCAVKNCRLEPTSLVGSAPQSMVPPRESPRGCPTRSSINNKTGFDWLIDTMISLVKLSTMRHRMYLIGWGEEKTLLVGGNCLCFFRFLFVALCSTKILLR